MKKDPIVYLNDILESVNAIAKYINGINFQQFMNQMAL